VPSVKKSMYFEPTTCASLSFGLLLTEEVPCPWLIDEVADEALAVDVALSVTATPAVEVAVVEAGASVAAFDPVEMGVELAESDRAIPGLASVDVALVDVAVRAATMPVLNAQTVRLERRTLATENARTLFFIPS
jgi:hypothetical protein